MDLALTGNRFQIQQLSAQDASEVLNQDVQEGLFERPRSLPPKYFYDDEGSKIFDAICKTQDYYPTRTESTLLQNHAQEIIDLVKPSACVELGAGTSTKTEILLSEVCDRLDDAGKFNYLSIDVCYEVLVESAQRLLSKFNNLIIKSIAGEYAPAIRAVSELDGPALYAFIGSSIANFSEAESIELLSAVASKMVLDDYFLIGMDRVKDKEILERAYDDSEGVTARFNLNVLNVLNYKLGANFDLSNFSHQAVYNEQKNQIEMYLVSQCKQEVNFPRLDKFITLEKDEKILTEISRKYTKASIRDLLGRSGLKEVMHFESENEYFSLVLAKKEMPK